MIDDTKSNSRKTYTLTGGIIHNGGTNSGHYIYITYQNNAWFSISDDKVVKIKESEAKNLLKINSTLITYKEVNESPKINQKSEANNQWNNKAESMASSFTHKNPSQGKESKNIEKPKIYNPWQGEINRMEKLLFFERIAAEWSSPSDKLINLNKDKNITENQKYARINTEKLSKETQNNINSSSCESKMNNVESSSLSMASQKNDDKVICNVCNKTFKKNGLKHMTKIHKIGTNGELTKFFRKE